MLSNYEKKKKQESFITKKIDELISAERAKNRETAEQFLSLSSFYLKLANKNIDNNEFTITSFNPDKFEILNKNNNGFIVEMRHNYNSWSRKSLSIRIQGVCGSKNLDSEYDLLIVEPFLEHFSEFEKEFVEISAKLDKDGKNYRYFAKKY